MKRPGSPVDPDVAAMLRRFLEQPSPPRAGAVRRLTEPPPPRLEVGYVLELPAAGSGGQPMVEVRQRVSIPGDKPAPWEPSPVTAARAASAVDPDDQRILEALREIGTTTASLAQVALVEDGAPSRFQLSRAARERVFPLLGRTGRFLLRRPGESAAEPLRWSKQPWEMRLAVNVVNDGADWEVRGVLRSGETALPLCDIEAFFEGNIALFQGQLGRIDDGGASSWLGLLRQHRRAIITPSRRAAFLEELFSLATPPPLDLPERIRLVEHSTPASPQLFVYPPELGEGPASPVLFARLSFEYAGLEVHARRLGKVAFDSAAMRLLRRDAAAEAAALAKLEALGLVPIPRTSPVSPPEGAHLQLGAVRLPVVVEALLAEGFKVEAAGKIYRRSTGSDVEVKASGLDWFDLRGSLHFDGMRVPLPAIVEALRRGQSAVLLDDGTLGMLPEEWLGRHGLTARLGRAQQGAIRFLPSQLALLDELLASQPSAKVVNVVQVDEAFAQARAALGEGRLTAPATAPVGFRGELRGYQREGLGWLLSLQRSGFGGCLADDMGLGKTVQVLALLAGRRGASGKPTLVVAPRSLLFNWKREAANFTPELRVLEHAGGDRRPPGEHWASFDLVLTTYGTLRRDVEAITAIELDYLILDEAQAIKNGASETARAARLLHAERRLALSGTPVENHLGELWSIFEFLNPGILGKASVFEAAAESPTPEALSLLRRALGPFLLRRTKAQVAPDLPERLEETWTCELGPAERAFYDELKGYYRGELLRRVSRDGLGASRVHVLEALLRLRQAACHPGLVDPKRKGEPSAKLGALLPKLLELRETGQKALVFSQFTSLLELVRPLLDAEGVVYEQLDGQTRDRQGKIDRFQNDPTCGLFLISLKAGGVGLNLTAAEYVFLLDPWWNPAAEAQAIDRAHRIGQARSVFAYRLLARDTVEERIAELKRQKQALAESVIRGESGPMKDLSLEDLERLLS